MESSKYESQLSKLSEVKSALDKNIKDLESAVVDKSSVIDNLNKKLDKTMIDHSELHQSFQSQLSFSENKTRNLTAKIESLNEQIEQMTYSLSIYEKQNESLTGSLQVT